MEKDQPSPVKTERQILEEAQQKGTGATLLAFVRLSGPGWLQSAITLGGGSLAGALFLGALGGVNMLWLQLMAIIMGVVMLSAISYVTLSTGERPFNAINNHINPALGWGWLIATSLANMIWCMPQFSLCYGALDGNLIPGMEEKYLPEPMPIGSGDDPLMLPVGPLLVSLVILVLVSGVVIMNARRGLAAKLFDLLLKGLVGMVVICFFGVVALLSANGELQWGEILMGFIPDFSQWNGPAGTVKELIAGMSPDAQAYWTEAVVTQQRQRMIGAAATAVGINMTFLMPYSMLHRGWDKPFRGLARFDLSTGMAIPYIIVTSCVVIAAAHAFHGKADEELLSTDPVTFQKSDIFGGTKDMLLASLNKEEFQGLKFDDAMAKISADVWADAPADDELTPEQRKQFKEEEADKKEELITEMAALPAAEKKVAASMVQRNATALAKTLAPLMGERNANVVFGLGVFGMGFSTIIILMLINGFVFCEASGKPDAVTPYVAGCIVAGVFGMLWPLLWQGDSKFFLAIVASNFGMMLLPIAYITFFMMMNSRSLLGPEKPTGGSMAIWNVLMGISVVGAVVAAAGAIWEKGGLKSLLYAFQDGSLFEEGALANSNILTGVVVFSMLVVYILFIVVGFFLKPREPAK